MPRDSAPHGHEVTTAAVISEEGCLALTRWPGGWACGLCWPPLSLPAAPGSVLFSGGEKAPRCLGPEASQRRSCLQVWHIRSISLWGGPLRPHLSEESRVGSEPKGCGQ